MNPSTNKQRSPAKQTTATVNAKTKIGKTKLARIDTLTPEQIARICDHTFLGRPEGYKTPAGYGAGNINAVREREKAFAAFLRATIKLPLLPYAICVRPEDCCHVRDFLREQGKSHVQIASVVGFPDGCWYSTSFKIMETKLAVQGGADEIDMVLDYRALKRGEDAMVKKDIDAVARTCRKLGVLLKVIFETSELSLELVEKACAICTSCNVDFVKTSTGFSASGAKAPALKVMREHFAKGVKMSGGVTCANVFKLLRAASGRDDGLIELDPRKVRIGESSLLANLVKKQG